MSFSGLGIGLSVVFGCLVFALIGQLYYLLWWKKRRTHAEIGDDDSNYSKGMLDGFCWNTLSMSSSHSSTRDPETKILESDLELGNTTTTTTTTKDVVLKSLGEESIESELMRLHNLAGPPRFLFTIKEETKEDLESEDGKSKRTRSLSDIMVAMDTPFLTPLAASPLKSPSNHHQGFSFNPLFESLSESEVSRFRSSPPPKFKFLRDAEEKLYRRLMMEEALRKAQSSSESGVKDSSPNSTMVNITTDDREGSFLRLIKNKDRDQKPQIPPSSSQILPLESSPTSTTFRPLEKESMVH